MSFVYVIGSVGNKGAKTYVGWTTNLERRLTAHNSGRGAKSTRGHHWRLLYAEKCLDKPSAMRREYALKQDHKFRRELRTCMDLA